MLQTFILELHIPMGKEIPRLSGLKGQCSPSSWTLPLGWARHWSWRELGHPVLLRQGAAGWVKSPTGSLTSIPGLVLAAPRFIQVFPWGCLVSSVGDGWTRTVNVLKRLV